MKTLIKSLLLAAIFCFANFTLNAQDDGAKRYYVVDYMKVENGMHDEYLKLEAAWKKIHQVNIDAGKYQYWTLTAVNYPYGTNEEYNYMTRTNFSGEKQLAAHMENWDMPDLKSILTEEEMALVKRTADIRTIVKSEVWSRTDQVMAENMDDAKVHVFNYFDFPEGSSPANHNRVEQEIWKPVHAARIKDGKIMGWVLLDMELPYGSAQPYHAATVDIYSNMEQFLNQDVMDYFGKVHPGKDVDKLMEETWGAADLIRSEVRTKVDGVGPSKVASN